MKKLIAALMSLCLLFCAAAAFAGEATENPSAAKWSDFEAEAAKVEGQFANVANTGLKMFIPAEFKDTEISEETLAGGTFMVLKSDKEEKAIVNAQNVAVDMAAFRASLENTGKVLFDNELNGLPCCQFSVETDGITSTCFAFSTEQGGVLVFSFSLSNQEPYTSLYKLMIASIQPAE